MASLLAGEAAGGSQRRAPSVATGPLAPTRVFEVGVCACLTDVAARVVSEDFLPFSPAPSPPSSHSLPPPLSPPRPKAEDSTGVRVAFEPQVNLRAALAAGLPLLPAPRRPTLGSPSSPALPGERSPWARRFPSWEAREPRHLPTLRVLFLFLPSLPPFFCCYCRF